MGYTEVDAYTETHIGQNGCDSIFILNLELLDIEDSACQPSLVGETDNSWKVYPNPTDGFLYIINSGSNNRPREIEIFSKNGERIKTELDGDSMIGLRDLPTVVYYIRIESKEKDLLIIPVVKI